jgi:hypothetical protein
MNKRKRCGVGRETSFVADPLLFDCAFYTKLNAASNSGYIPIDLERSNVS